MNPPTFSSSASTCRLYRWRARRRRRSSPIAWQREWSAVRGGGRRRREWSWRRSCVCPASQIFGWKPSTRISPHPQTSHSERHQAAHGGREGGLQFPVEKKPNSNVVLELFLKVCLNDVVFRTIFRQIRQVTTCHITRTLHFCSTSTANVIKKSNGFVNALLSFLSDAPFVVFCKHRCKSRRPTHKEICQQVSFGWSICSNRRKKIRREPFLKKFSDKHYWGRWSGTSSARRRKILAMRRKNFWQTWGSIVT